MHVLMDSSDLLSWFSFVCVFVNVVGREPLKRAHSFKYSEKQKRVKRYQRQHQNQHIAR